MRRYTIRNLQLDNMLEILIPVHMRRYTKVNDEMDNLITILIPVHMRRYTAPNFRLYSVGFQRLLSANDIFINLFIIKTLYLMLSIIIKIIE